MPAERRIEMHHRRQRRDLVRRDVVAQRPGADAREVGSGELDANERRIDAQEEASAEGRVKS
jgi:hypothetical protein